MLLVVAAALWWSGSFVARTLAIALVGTMAAVLRMRIGFWKAFVEFVFDLRIGNYFCQSELRGELSSVADHGSLFLVHPHGILTLGWSCNMVWNRQWHALASRAEQKCRFLIAPALRWYNPLFKLVCDWSGCLEEATKRQTLKLMSERSNIAIYPGGFEDATAMTKGRHVTYIRARKGIFKYALMHGYKVTPVYTFGETDSFHTLSWALEARLWLNRFGVPAVCFFGEWWCPPLALHSARILTYVGKPMQLPKIESPTNDDVSEWHGKYVQALTHLFNEQKEHAGHPNAQLEIR